MVTNMFCIKKPATKSVQYWTMLIQLSIQHRNNLAYATVADNKFLNEKIYEAINQIRYKKK